MLSGIYRINPAAMFELFLYLFVPIYSGMRNRCDVAIYINLKLAMDDGIRFYRSANNVILSEGIDGVISPKYFQEVRFL